jgi:putative tricarboxylic transport membrane protein
MSNHALDRLTGIFFVFLGFAVVAGAWAMPRFEAQGAPAYQSPGLTPGLLGLALAGCGLILALRGKREDGAEHTYWNTVIGTPVNRNRAVAALALTLIYGAVLFGNVPYVLATFLFVFAFVCTFEIILKPEGSTRRPLPSLIAAALLGLVTSFGSQYVFQTLFLVRLP